MNYQEIEEKHKELINTAINFMSNINDYEHNMNHIKDVVDYTKLLLDRVNLNIDKEACIIAAYWHDVGRIKDNEMHEVISADMLKTEMTRIGYNDDFIDRCYQAIINHRWDMTPTTIEGYLIKDADKLSFIGLNRWNECIKHKKRLDKIIEILPSLKSNVLFFEESKEIFENQLINLIKLLHDEVMK